MKEPSKKTKKNSGDKSQEAVRAYEAATEPLGSYTGTPAVRDGKRYMRMTGIAPLVNMTGQSTSELMMPPVLPSVDDEDGLIAGEPADLTPEQDADDL